MTLSKLAAGIITGLLLVAVAVIVIFGGWKLGWWFTNQNASRQYQLQQNGTSNQDTLRKEISKYYTQLAGLDVQIAGAKGNTGMTGQLKVEAAAVAGDICYDGEQVNTAVAMPPDQVAWVRANCTMGVVAPTSKYFIPMTP